MYWILWVILGILGFILLTLFGIRVYFYSFGKKVAKKSTEILDLLENGLLEDFRQNKPYEEVREKYCQFIDALDVFSEYVHFLSLHKEKKYVRHNEYLIMQCVEVEGKKVARMHFRTFPIRDLAKKIKPKEMYIEALKIFEQVLNEEKDIAYIELITHNLLISKSVLDKIISRYDLQLTYTYSDDFEIGYMPWIYSEWVMINGGENPKSQEVYERLRKLNCPINVKVYRK